VGVGARDEGDEQADSVKGSIVAVGGKMVCLSIEGKEGVERAPGSMIRGRYHLGLGGSIFAVKEVWFRA